jgi:N-acetylneuraminate synthase
MSVHTFIIAEAGVNHDGSTDDALRLVDAAADAGADVVKFQTFKAEAVIARGAAKAAYQERTTGGAESQLEMVRKLELSHAAHVRVAAHCKARGIEFMSTPFDMESARFLAHELGVARLKIPSGEITNLPFLVELARLNLPLIMSSGASTLEDIRTALGALSVGFAGSDPSKIADFAARLDPALLAGRVSLLHCTSEYPSPPRDANLAAMDTMRTAFNLPVGLSDHSVGITIPIAAVACGATIIEKHFTLDRTRPGPDHAASLEPGELAAMVSAIRDVERAIGDGIKRPSPSEAQNQSVIRRSLVAARAIAAGEVFSGDNLAAKRPAGGLPPAAVWQVSGRLASRAYAADEMIDGAELP